MPALLKSDWPTDCHRPECKGIFVEGCVERGDGSRFRAKAHAHWLGPFAGWLCFLSARRLEQRELVLHELAHLISPGGHHDKWRATVLKIGGTLDSVIDSQGPGLLLGSYQKQKRK